MITKVVFNKVAQIPELPGFSVVSQHVSGDGDALVLYVESQALEIVTAMMEAENGVVFPLVSMPEPAAFRLSILSPGDQKTVELPELDTTFPYFDIFPDGRVVVAGSRSYWRANDDFGLNGIIIDPVTGERERFLPGDGIQRLAVDARGRIWVSYFDEGILGNNGYGDGGTPPVGTLGLNRFNGGGDLVWVFTDAEELESGPIIDCYALNVSDDQAALYADTYDGYVLYRISANDETELFKSDLQGCQHFAIDDSQILFTGQIDDDYDIGYFGRLSSGGVSEIQDIKFLLPGGSKLYDGQFVGRGDTLHFFDESNWYSTSIDALFS